MTAEMTNAILKRLDALEKEVTAIRTELEMLEDSASFSASRVLALITILSAMGIINEDSVNGIAESMLEDPEIFEKVERPTKGKGIR